MVSTERHYKIKSEVFLYPGMGGWHFIGVPKKQSGEIKEKYGKQVRGWGSIRVLVTLGKTSWKTSIFPDKKSGTYLLPIKAEVRKKEQIRDGEQVTFTIVIHG